MIKYLNCFSKIASKLLNILTIFAVIVAVGIVITMLAKRKESRKFLCYLLGVVVICAGVFAGFKINNKRQQESFSIGSNPFENLFTTKTFSFQDKAVTLYEDNSDTYSYTVDLMPVTDFDGSKNSYTIMLNDYVLMDAKITAGQVEANFYKDFIGVDGKILNSGVMAIRITMLSNKTTLKISTVGEVNKDFYTQYFNDNGINLRIIENKRSV